MTYIPGDYWMICDVCGMNIRRSQSKRRWDGAVVCSADFEVRQPQDFLKGRIDRQTVPVARPEPEDNLLAASITSGGSL